MTVAVLVALVLIAVALLAPRAGLVDGWRRRTAQRRRETAENALKHLLGQATAGQASTLSSLQRALRTSDRALVTLMDWLARKELVHVEGDRLWLTAKGERLAGHIVRAHRLWMGHLDTDPHGDPIPSRDGEVQAVPVSALSTWPVERPAPIVHLEDEPPLAFAQLASLGLHPGQVVRVVERSAARLVLRGGEQEYVLAPMLAGDVQVIAAGSMETVPEAMLRLSDLSSGQLGEIVALDPACRGFMRRRLLDLGFTPGARVRPDLTTFAGDPRAYRVRGTTIALRRDQSARVIVRAVA